MIGFSFLFSGRGETAPGGDSSCPRLSEMDWVNHSPDMSLSSRTRQESWTVQIVWMVSLKFAVLCEMNPTPGEQLELRQVGAMACAGVLELNMQESIFLLCGDNELSVGCRLLRGFDDFNG